MASQGSVHHRMEGLIISPVCSAGGGGCLWAAVLGGLGMEGKRWSRAEVKFIVGNKHMRKRKDLSLVHEYYLSPGDTQVLRLAGHWLRTEGCVSTRLAG